MRRFVDGCIYDSDKSRYLGVGNDGKFIELRRTDAGRYFLFNEDANFLDPISGRAAREWAIGNLDEESCARYFGCVEPEERVGLLITVSASVKSELLHLAKIRGTASGNIVEALVDRYLEESREVAPS